MSSNIILIFHLDEVCIRSMSMNINRPILDDCTNKIQVLENVIDG